MHLCYDGRQAHGADSPDVLREGVAFERRPFPLPPIVPQAQEDFNDYLNMCATRPSESVRLLQTGSPRSSQ